MLNAVMKFDPGEDVNALRDMVHRRAQERIKPMAQEIDKSNSSPNELWPEAGEMGLLGSATAEAYGGAGCHAVCMWSRLGTLRWTLPWGLSDGAHAVIRAVSRGDAPQIRAVQG